MHRIIDNDVDELLDLVGRGLLEPATAETPTSASRSFSERFRLLQRIGVGGTSEVWRARHFELGIDVAIKVLKESTDGTGGRSRMFREARAVASVRHPNVVHIYEVGEYADGLPYIVMELLEGETLAMMLRDGPIEWTVARDLLLQLADGLRATHRAGIVHRDLKPANVIVTQDEHGRRQCHIIDFGFAKSVQVIGGSGSFTQRGEIFGTPHYMAPEQIRGEQVDERADIYALGCVMYEVLVGTKLFDVESPYEALYSHLFRPPPQLPIGTMGALKLRSLLHDALEKTAERRLSSVERFCEVLWSIPESVRVEARMRRLGRSLLIALAGGGLAAGFYEYSERSVGPPNLSASTVPAFGECRLPEPTVAEPMPREHAAEPSIDVAAKAAPFQAPTSKGSELAGLLDSDTAARERALATPPRSRSVDTPTIRHRSSNRERRRTEQRPDPPAPDNENLRRALELLGSPP